MRTALVLAGAMAIVGALTAAAGHAASRAPAGPDVEIVAVDLRGRQTNLTHNPGLDVSPAVARDGRIAFMSARDGQPDLFVMDADGGNVHRVTNSAADDSGIALAEDLEWSQASWSPDGARIAFDGKYQAVGPPCEQHCASWHVLVVGSDGRRLEEVARDARAPAWSPEGRRIAYESDVDADFQSRGITVTRLDGEGSVGMRAVNGESAIGPVWSPNGREVAFQASRAEGAGTWISTARADGTRKRRLAAGRNPSWSPDGRWIAYISDGYLYTMHPTGRRRQRLTPKGLQVLAFAWSPSGRSLAVVFGKDLRIETVTADGRHLRLIRREPAGSYLWSGPIWAPGGRILLAVALPSG